MVVALATAGCLPWEDLSSGYDAGLGAGATASSSGSATGGSDGGPGGDAGRGGAGGSGDLCPATGRGPTMVPAVYQLTRFCIDRTEVTDDQYGAFVLDTRDDTTGQPLECEWNETYQTANPGGRSDFPAVGMDQCDAKAFCAWAGKHLCGPVERGDVDWALTQWQRSQWTFACTEAGAHDHAYGDVPVQGRCNFSGELMGVGTNPDCEGGFPGLLDMLGNVWEWVDRCDPPGDAGAGEEQCSFAGGGYQQSHRTTGCDVLGTGERSYIHPDLGFRCCAPVP